MIPRFVRVTDYREFYDYHNDSELNSIAELYDNNWSLSAVTSAGLKTSNGIFLIIVNESRSVHDYPSHRITEFRLSRIGPINHHVSFLLKITPGDIYDLSAIRLQAIPVIGDIPACLSEIVDSSCVLNSTSGLLFMYDGGEMRNVQSIEVLKGMGFSTEHVYNGVPDVLLNNLF